ncbi:MAG TPA: restriction endonuclease subunit S [Pyrinomonadaceae bacterium]|nr:restriction endonuclease subunit S [Pyrinomonadaceae bacterium]
MKDGWQTKTLGEVLQPTEMVNPLQSPEAEFDYIDVSSVSNATFQIEEAQHIKGKDAPSRARRLVKANDVLFATVRPTLRRIAIVPERLDSQVCSTGYLVLRPKEGIDHRFVFHWLFTEGFMGQMERLQKGTSYPAVNDSEVRAQVIPLPPLAEQRRIVGILDKAFESIAIVKANAEENLRNARDLFESHLQSIFTKRSAAWLETTLGEVCKFIGGSQPPKTVFSRAKSGDNVRLIQIRDYKSDKYIVYIPISQARRFCKADDIMIGRYGPPIFQILRGLEGAYNVALMKAVPDETKLTRDFLFYFLKHSAVQQYVIFHSDRAAGQSGLNKDTIEPYPIALPSLTEQAKIIATIRQLENAVERLESLYQAKLAAFNELKKSLLHQAFGGELSLQRRRALVIPFPTRIPNITTTDLHAGILAIAYQLHEKHRKQSYFGHVKAEKIAHMIEAHLGIDLERNPIKDAAGPNDYPHLKRVEHRAKKAGFFLFQESEEAGYRITKYPGFNGLIDRTRSALGNRNRDIDALLEVTLPMNTKQAEIFATVYAAWNNLLLDKKTISDEAIVFEARENWHPDKLEIKRQRFFDAIKWMKEKGVIPTGKGKKVNSKVKKKKKQ